MFQFSSSFDDKKEKPSINLFGINSEKNLDKESNYNIFDLNNKTQNKSISFGFGNSIFDNIKNNQISSNIFGASRPLSVKENDSNRLFSLGLNINQKKEPRNNNNSKEEKKKCIHVDNYIAYCTKDSEDEGGLLCYNCLYDYHNDHISQCIPIKFDNFENYKNYYKDHINKCKIILKEKFDEIISKLEEYEKEEIEDISKLFEKKN